MLIRVYLRARRTKKLNRNFTKEEDSSLVKNFKTKLEDDTGLAEIRDVLLEKNGRFLRLTNVPAPDLDKLLVTRGPFLESPDNKRARKAVVVYMQDRGFNSFASNMIKPSVNETKWRSLLARIRALILYISLPRLSRNGPL